MHEDTLECPSAIVHCSVQDKAGFFRETMAPATQPGQESSFVIIIIIMLSLKITILRKSEHLFSAANIGLSKTHRIALILQPQTLWRCSCWTKSSVKRVMTTWNTQPAIRFAQPAASHLSHYSVAWSYEVAQTSVKVYCGFFTVRVCVCVLPSPLRAGPLVALATPSPRRAPAARTAGATWWATRLCRAASQSHPETCRLQLRLPRSHLCCSWSLQRERERE